MLIGCKIKKNYNLKGFTLVELAVVIVIIGLLIAGILQGKDLIEQSNINSFINTVNKFQTAASAFRLKYNALPGDIPSPTKYGFSSAQNPNGDKFLNSIGTHFNNNNLGVCNANPSEIAAFFMHLSQSKMIGESYTGCTSATGVVIGETYPKMVYGEGFAPFTDNANGKNYFTTSIVRRSDNINNGYKGSGGGIDADIAFQIDAKLDDGKAHLGLVSYASADPDSHYISLPSTNEKNSGACSVSASETSDYNITTTTKKGCALRIQMKI